MKKQTLLEKAIQNEGRHQTIMHRRLLTRKEVAPLLGYKCTESVKRLERAGLLKVIVINSRVKRYEMAEVERFIASGRV